jgi:hypothetical protein
MPARKRPSSSISVKASESTTCERLISRRIASSAIKLSFSRSSMALLEALGTART